MINNRKNINQSVAPKPICISFLFAIDNLDNLSWPSTLVHLRNCLTFENPCFPDPGLIDPIDLIKFILRRIHKESLLKGAINPPKFFTNPDNNQTIFNHQLALQAYTLCLNNYKSCISDCFFGTYEITKFCSVCQKKKFYFQHLELIHLLNLV